MCPRTCALGLSSSLLSENKKKTTKVCEIGDRESYFGALFILWIHGKNSHIRTTCKLGGHDLLVVYHEIKIKISFSALLFVRLFIIGRLCLLSPVVPMRHEFLFKIILFYFILFYFILFYFFFFFFFFFFFDF